MAAVSDARFFRIKAAQRDLIAMVGGVERAGELTSYGKSTVGRWNDAGDPTLMPLSAVWLLEGECGSPVVTSALAGVNGHRLEQDRQKDPADNSDILLRHADAVGRAAEVMQAGALAFSDNKLTPAEAQQIDRTLSALSQSVDEYRKSIAHARAIGGFQIVEGGK